MHNFLMVFGAAMMIFFGVVAFVGLIMLIGSVISGVQYLLLFPCCAAGAGLSAELFDDGPNVKNKE